MGEQFSASDIVSAPSVYSVSDIQGFTGNPARAKRQAAGGGQRTPAEAAQSRRDAGPPDNLSPLSPAYHVGAGVQQIGEGVTRMGEPGWEKLGGASDIARGAMQVAAPFTLPTSLATAPVKTLLGLVGGGVAGGLAEGGFGLAGSPPGLAEAAGTAAGVAGGVAASRIPPFDMPEKGKLALPGVARFGLRMIPGGRAALHSFDTLNSLADTMRPEEETWKPFQPSSTTSRRMGSSSGNYDPVAESRGGGGQSTRWKSPEEPLTITPPPNEPSMPGEAFQRNPVVAKRMRFTPGGEPSGGPSYANKPRPRPSTTTTSPEPSPTSAPPAGFDPEGWAKLTPQQQSTLRSAVEKGAEGRQPSAPGKPLTPPPGTAPTAGPRTVTNTEWNEADPRNIAKDVVHWNAQLKNEKMANFYVNQHGAEAAAKLESLPDTELIQHLRQNGFDAPRKNAGSTQSMQRPLSQVRADIKREIQTRLRLTPPPGQ